MPQLLLCSDEIELYNLRRMQCSLVLRDAKSDIGVSFEDKFSREKNVNRSFAIVKIAAKRQGYSSFQRELAAYRKDDGS